MNRIFFKPYLLTSLLLLSMVGCSSEEINISNEDDLVIAASIAEVTSRANAALEAFPDQTQYSIYGVYAGGTNWTTDRLWTKSAANPIECIETKGQIDYKTKGGPISLGMRNADFYGFTYGSATEKVDATNYLPSDPGSIVVQGKTPKGPLKDLLFSNNLKDCNASQGILQMEFKHALSKIKFQIYKQDESSFSANKRYFENAYLKEILIETYDKAVFNVKTGSWQEATGKGASQKVQKTFFSTTTTSPTLQTSIQPVASGKEMLLIPNCDNQPIKVTVTIGGIRIGSKTNQESTVDYNVNTLDPSGNVGPAVLFQPNYQYTLSIGVLREKGDVIIAFNSLVEPWNKVDIDLGETH